jgi:hypothetical protein
MNLAKKLMQDRGVYNDHRTGERRMEMGMFAGLMLMSVSNSTQIITDLGTALANSPYSTTAQANSNNPNGPIMALYDNILLVQRKAQEMAELLAYLLGGSQVQGSLTAPTGGPITSAADSATYNLLVGVYQILK